MQFLRFRQHEKANAGAAKRCVKRACVAVCVCVRLECVCCNDDKVIKRQWKEQEAAKGSVKLHKLQPYPTVRMASRYESTKTTTAKAVAAAAAAVEQHDCPEQQQQQQSSQQARLINKGGDQAKQTNESAKDKRER